MVDLKIMNRIKTVGRQALGTRVVLYLLLAGFIISERRSVCAQECPDSPSCEAVFGSLELPTLSTNAANRVVHAEQASPDGAFMDELIGLSYNRSWNAMTAFGRDDATQPSTWMGLESYWNGNMELNIDISGPNSIAFSRPLGFDAAYNGSVTQLQVGGLPYARGAAGVMLQGGTGSLSSLLTITDQLGRSSYSNMLDMSRSDGTDSFVWRAGLIPRLNFALQENLNASGFGNFGVLKFAGEWDYGEPLLDFESVGTGAILLRSLPASTDSFSRFMVLANGTLKWGPGNLAPDTDLYRSATSSIRTDGNLIVGGNLAVIGQKAALVTTASYGQREVYAVESPGEWFEDFGSARLVGAQAVVKVDPVFGETVSTGRQYHVFLTPSGKCSLYVADKEPTFFKVKRLAGWRHCAFDYRIVAKRRGYEDVRLAEIPPSQDTKIR
jgi:hypothetical protein